MIVCLILAIIILIAGLVIGIYHTKEYADDLIEATGFIIGYLFLASIISFLLVLPFLALDKSSGSTIGKITSVDKNFFGTTAIYLKVNETKEEEYCAEDEEIIELAKEYIGKYVKVSYGTRVGLYHLNQCRQAPIEKIEIQNENNT